MIRLALLAAILATPAAAQGLGPRPYDFGRMPTYGAPILPPLGGWRGPSVSKADDDVGSNGVYRAPGAQANPNGAQGDICGAGSLRPERRATRC